MNRVPKKEAWIYYFGIFGQNLSCALMMNYFMNFCTDVLYVEPYIIGIVLGIARVWDSVNDPIIGTMIDRHRFKNGEKLQIHYPRQFEQITTALLEMNGEDIISTVNRIREQFNKWGSKKIDVESMPELSEEDFWNPERFLEGQ